MAVIFVKSKSNKNDIGLVKRMGLINILILKI
jgi:hypothetical protein